MHEKCEPLNRESKKKLTRIILLSKMMNGDARSINVPGDYSRLEILREHASEILSLCHEVGDQVDIYGVRRRKREEEIKRRLPAPDHQPLYQTIIPPVRVRQLHLLPAPRKET